MTHRYIVEVLWNDEDENRVVKQNATMHGPFDNAADAEAWAENEVGDDPSADTYFILLINDPSTDKKERQNA